MRMKILILMPTMMHKKKKVLVWPMLLDLMIDFFVVVGSVLKGITESS